MSAAVRRNGPSGRFAASLCLRPSHHAVAQSAGGPVAADGLAMARALNGNWRWPAARKRPLTTQTAPLRPQAPLTSGPSCRRAATRVAPPAPRQPQARPLQSRRPRLALPLALAPRRTQRLVPTTRPPSEAESANSNRRTLEDEPTADADTDSNSKKTTPASARNLFANATDTTSPTKTTGNSNNSQSHTRRMHDCRQLPGIVAVLRSTLETQCRRTKFKFELCVCVWVCVRL